MKIILSILSFIYWLGIARADIKPNILIIVADDLGYGDLGCYGATKINTPRLDKLAGESVRFTDAHSICATCMPSRYAILSGTYFHHAKGKGGYSTHFHEGQITLPSSLKSAGYRTAALGKWHNGFGLAKEPNWNAELKPGPLEIGFDTFFGTPRTHNEPPLVFVEGHRIVGFDAADPISVDMSPEFGRWGKTIGGTKAQAARPDERIDFILAEKAENFLAHQTKDKPFFLYLAMAAPHNPINPAPEFRGKSKAGNYGDYIQQLDHCTGLVLDALEKHGLAQNTIVIFTSDNGGRYERAALKAGHRTNGALLGQKTDGWEGGHRVPLMARWPHHIKPGTVRKEFFLQVDIMATLAEAAKIALPAGASPDGSSELAAFTSPASAPAKRTEGVIQSSGSYVLRQGDWVYIPKAGSAGYSAPEREKPWSVPYAIMGFKNSDVDEQGQIKPGAPKEQLYDLSTDLAQSKNIATEHPERVAAMRARLEELTGKTLSSTGPKGISIDLDAAVGGPGEFAGQEIRREAAASGTTLGDNAKATRISLTVGNPDHAAAQSYRIRVQMENGCRNITVIGADAVGAMYGGLDVAEAIRTGTIDALKDSDHTPHIAQRGIKFNIPLDLRTPSYTDPSDAAQANIPEMWSMDFWRAFFDDMARHRYNVLSLWSLHPFPSIVKVPEFPHVALDDVWRTKENLDASFDHNGNDFVRPDMLANHEVVKRMTMDEKIQFWRDVMQLGKDRGIDLYWFTWNVFLHGAEGNDGITNDKTASRTIEYFRASVRETIKTYPLLAGFGITAGEGMPEGKFKEMSKEQWLWKTYGEGIRDGLKDTPERKFRLIHRFHMTALGEIQKEFADLPCTLDLSFKYAIAHMYSVPDPGMIKPVLPLLNPDLRCWLTVRNDDIYSFRWADVDYARAFMKAIPGEDKIAGFYMGPDGYCWGREFLSKDASSPRQTVMQKQWLSFALWGRLAYEPDLSASTFERLTAARFAGADVPKLTAAWADASKTFPYITRFFWGDIDIKWFPEACRKKGGFYTVRDFMEGGTMPGAGVLNIVEWRTALLAQQQPSGVTPLEIAATLHANGSQALAALPELQRATVTPAVSATEYAATLGDIEAMSQLGLYYAAKIRGACDLALFDKSGDVKQQASAVQHLEAALTHWKNYSTAYTRQYIQPVLYNRAGVVDIPKQIEDVINDVQIARDWKQGTLKEAKIKRSGTEAGFRQ